MKINIKLKNSNVKDALEIYDDTLIKVTDEKNKVVYKGIVDYAPKEIRDGRWHKGANNKTFTINTEKGVLTVKVLDSSVRDSLADNYTSDAVSHYLETNQKYMKILWQNKDKYEKRYRVKITRVSEGNYVEGKRENIIKLLKEVYGSDFNADPFIHDSVQLKTYKIKNHNSGKTYSVKAVSYTDAVKKYNKHILEDAAQPVEFTASIVFTSDKPKTRGTNKGYTGGSYGGGSFNINQTIGDVITSFYNYMKKDFDDAASANIRVKKLLIAQYTRGNRNSFRQSVNIREVEGKAVQSAIQIGNSIKLSKYIKDSLTEDDKNDFTYKGYTVLAEYQIGFYTVPKNIVQYRIYEPNGNYLFAVKTAEQAKRAIDFEIKNRIKDSLTEDDKQVSPSSKVLAAVKKAMQELDLDSSVIDRVYSFMNANVHQTTVVFTKPRFMNAVYEKLSGKFHRVDKGSNNHLSIFEKVKPTGKVLSGLNALQKAGLSVTADIEIDEQTNLIIYYPKSITSKAIENLRSNLNANENEVYQNRYKGIVIKKSVLDSLTEDFESALERESRLHWKNFKIGARVRHKKHGLGTIIDRKDERLYVEFDKGGIGQYYHNSDLELVKDSLTEDADIAQNDIKSTYLPEDANADNIRYLGFNEKRKLSFYSYGDRYFVYHDLEGRTEEIDKETVQKILKKNIFGEIDENDLINEEPQSDEIVTDWKKETRKR